MRRRGTANQVSEASVLEVIATDVASMVIEVLCDSNNVDWSGMRDLGAVGVDVDVDGDGKSEVGSSAGGTIWNIRESGLAL